MQPNRFLSLALLLFWASGSSLAAGPNDAAFWYTETATDSPIIQLHFFWTATCPHCQEAQPFIKALPEQLPWLQIHDYPLSGSAANLELYIDYAKQMKLERIAVPGFMFCQRLETGYHDRASTGEYLIRELTRCYAERIAARGSKPDLLPTTTPGAPSPAKTGTAPLPIIGSIDTQDWSLPMLTLVLASLDAFNPCAFFVLLFLLSLLAHAQSRSRMLIIGGVFVFFSGLIYFIFMAAWLNIFLYAGELRLVTLLAGSLAILIGLINGKDFFWYKKGISLSIPAAAKPGLFQRMRMVIGADSLGTMLAGTVVLAIIANSYELLCTAGFPMVYTRALTLQPLGTFDYYGYLIVYNVIYVVPLALIVLAFTYTLGSHKLSEFGGRVLKLISGYMMLALGVLLLLAPDRLNNALVSISLLLLVLTVAGLTVYLQSKSRR